jgi:hypothetical protein
MAKRFSATEIWEEDWFLDMPNEYKLFWYYMLSTCDHAGLFKVNVGSFCKLLSVKIDPEKYLELINTGKLRVRPITGSLWLIEDFFVFQYGHVFNHNNKVHQSIANLYKKYNINILEVRGLSEVKERTKRGQEGVNDTPKDKEHDKDKEIHKEENIDFRKIGLVPEMMKILKSSYPFYAEDEINDYPACLAIAYKIAKQKGWMKESVVNGNMDETLMAWHKIVEFSTSDKWYATRSVSDFNKEFQRIVQGMVQKNKTPTKKEVEPQQTAPSLKYLNHE